MMRFKEKRAVFGSCSGIGERDSLNSAIQVKLASLCVLGGWGGYYLNLYFWRKWPVSWFLLQPCVNWWRELTVMIYFHSRRTGKE